MRARLAQSLDRLVIRLACAGVAQQSRHPPHVAEARKALEDPELFSSGPGPRIEPQVNRRGEFQFPSPVSSPWAENNVACGQWHRVEPNGPERPTVILLHGWNAEGQYERQFPYLAWRFRRRGINALRLQLPYHGPRRPQAPEAVSDFISSDLARMVEATRQAILEVRGLVRWLREQGAPRVGLWGISLGGWLGALLATVERDLSSVVLMTPVIDLPRAIRELPFCAPISQALDGAELPLHRLLPVTRRPMIATDKILLVESLHDQFAPIETLAALADAWKGLTRWRLRHGHISVLFSPWALERVVGWMRERMTN